MIFTGIGNPRAKDDSVNEHVFAYREQLEKAIQLRPVRINCHGGTDRWTIDEAVKFYTEAVKINKEFGVRVGFETHRGYPTHSPWNTKQIVERVPDISLTADLSHWVLVAERILNAKDEQIIKQIAPHVIHIHARVGYEQGPQVPDPRDPKWAKHVEAHERWWEMIWQAHVDANEHICTLTPEFGPADYLHTLPFTNVPVAPLAEICDWQTKRQLELFQKFIEKIK